MTSREVDSTTDTYATKLAKLIPAEVSAAYLAINSLVPVSDGYSPTILTALGVLTVLCVAYLYLIQKVTSPLQIVFTTASFPLWALNISSARSDALNPTTLGVILILATVMFPLIPTKSGT